MYYKIIAVPHVFQSFHQVLPKFGPNQSRVVRLAASNSAFSRVKQANTGGRRKGLPLRAYGLTLFDQYVVRSVAAAAANSNEFSSSSPDVLRLRSTCVFRAPAAGPVES